MPDYVDKLATVRAEWTVIQAKEIDFYELLSDALAALDVADDRLDDFAIRFSNEALALTGQNRKAKLYTHYFKKPLHELIRPVLSGQLLAMDGWLTSLAEPGTPPSLAAMLPELTGLVDAGQTASKARGDLKQKIKQFREVGERRQLVDHVNAVRKELHGVLAKYALETPGLPSGFADRFFKPGEPGDDAPEEEETVDALATAVKAMEEALLEKKALLAKRIQDAEDAANKEQAKAETLAKVAALNQDIEEKQKEAKALLESLDD